MLTTIQRATIVAPSPPSLPRLFLAPSRAGRAVLDGGWWPRSRDPVAELPGLVLALAARYGPIRQIMLNSSTWDGHFRRLTIGTGVVRIGWFASLDPAVLIATTDRGDQIDLLVVAPGTPAGAATQAMTTAADPANVIRAPAILAAMPTPPMEATVDDGAPGAVWDNEGGHAAAAGPRRPTTEMSTAVSS